MNTVQDYTSESEGECDTESKLEDKATRAHTDIEVKQTGQSNKRQKRDLPPIPNLLLDKFHRSPGISTNMNAKKLSTKPLGYFNSYCSIEFLPNSKQNKDLNSILMDLNLISKWSPLFRRYLKNTEFTSLFNKELANVSGELHVSLTGNFLLQRHSKDKLKLLLDSKLSRISKDSQESNIITFTTNGLKFYRSVDRLRLFAALDLSEKSKSYLRPISDIITDSIKEVSKGDSNLSLGEDVIHIYDQPCNFDNSHVSIAISDILKKEITDQELHQLEDETSIVAIEPSLTFQFNSLKMLDGTSRRSFKIGDYTLND